MLAEPRRRQKYSVNPRGLDWSNDDTKVGQKLLEKMGWEKGKALGLKEDGCKEHVKVSTKSDRQGIGCTAQYADNWIAHQEDFNSILSALNKDTNTESSVAAFSLQDKSKNSRSRVHYQKFIKGKDLSGYHSTDLNCIFGERKKNVAKTKQQRTEEESEPSSQNAEENRSFGVLTVTSSTSIDSYFATKLAKLRSKSKKNPRSETFSAAANDIVFTNKHDQTKQQLTPTPSSGTSPAADCNTPTVKQRKKKREKVDIDDDCHTNDEHLHLRSFNSNATSKKKKRHVDDLLEITVECNSSSQNVKTCRRKKGRPSTTVTSILNHSGHTSVRSKTNKKKLTLTHDAR